MTDTHDVRTLVRERYGSIAEGQPGAAGGCCGDGCGCGDVMTQIGYSAGDAAAVPAESNLGLGCGNPIAHAEVREGETVLDLGSGAGIDCFLAARAVGPTGRVIGVDMTPAMIDRARAAAVKGAYANVEFRLGEIEHLPVADASVDLVISNCVVNLSPEKEQVFREALRVLKPGGRLVVSDLVWIRPMPESIRGRVDALVGCVAGASLKPEYLDFMARAGFTAIEVLEETPYTVGIAHLAHNPGEREAFDSVRSVKVRGIKAR
ncbi:MAG TPA: arsenite methyltransferase [Candidatus Eisenbacteria bacterium]